MKGSLRTSTRPQNNMAKSAIQERNKYKKLTKDELIERLLKSDVRTGILQNKLKRLEELDSTQEYLRLADELQKANAKIQNQSNRLSRFERFTPMQNRLIDWISLLLVFAGVQIPLLLILKWLL